MPKEKSCQDLTEQLIHQIEDYTLEENRRYAIGLEGDWGSGKTRFIEQEVAPHLKKKGVDLIRVSMFGVSSTADLYEHIAMALVHLNDRSEKTRAIIKAVGGTVGNFVGWLAKKVGLSLNVTVSMQSIAYLLLDGKVDGKGRLLVLDDVERRSVDCDDLSLFGAVNDLVEGMGVKVLLVSNSLSINEGGDVREFDKNVREKLIWKVYHFEPGPTALAKEILAKELPPIPDVDVRGAIIAGAEASGCSNARAMIRAERLVRELCGLDALRDDSIAPQNRFSAIRDSVHFSLLSCMGREPKQEEPPKSVSPLSPEAFANYKKQELYEQYKDFPAISRYFNQMGEVSSIDLEKGFREYIAKRYPHDASTLEVKAICERARSIYYFEDDDVESLLEGFHIELLKGSFSATLLRDVINAYFTFDRLGFISYELKTDFLKSCEQVVDRNPRDAFENLADSYLYFDLPDDPRAALANRLRDRARSARSRQIASKLTSYSRMTGSELSVELKNLIDMGEFAIIPRIDPIVVANTFLESTAKEQEDLRLFFRRLKSFLDPKREETKPFVEWIEVIKKRINSTPVESKTGSMRKHWFVEDLSALLDLLESGLKPTCKSQIE